MHKLIKLSALLLASVLALSGCALKTVDELYCLPKRSQTYNNLQSVIDEAMDGLEYCAPQSGDNRQVVQMADLDGDGVDEYLLFAQDDGEKPLKILIFCQLASGYVLMDTIEGYGFGFDFVTYAQLDDKPGVEIVVGRLVSEEVVRSVSVYRFSSGIARHMLTTAYSRMVVADPDGDSCYGLYLLNQGASETDKGTLCMYAYQEDQLQRIAEEDISCQAGEYKQIEVGALSDGAKALYVTCAAGDQLITDVFLAGAQSITAIVQNVQSGALNGNYIAPEDMDRDGVLEIPRLIPMYAGNGQCEEMIEWYCLDSAGIETVKCYTYHNFADNWYLELDEMDWGLLAVVRIGGSCTFSVYDPETEQMLPLYTITALTDADREQLALQPGRVVLYRSDLAVYVADLTENAQTYGIDSADLALKFKTIRGDLTQEGD